ncbi:hypothetical protein BCR36DRAFT_272730, partial [Piromyces finnis]
PPKSNINPGRNNYVAQKPKNIDNFRSQPYYGPNRGRDNPNSRGNYYDRPPNNSFERSNSNRRPYKPTNHDRGYYSPPPPSPPLPPPSGGYRNSYPPAYDRYDRNDNLHPSTLSPHNYDRYDRNDNPPYNERYPGRVNKPHDNRDHNRGEPPLPPPPTNERYNKRINGGMPMYDKYDRSKTGINPSSQYYNRRDNPPPPPPPPPPMYDHHERRNNHLQQGYDRRGKGPAPPPGPRFDRRDHNPPPAPGYYDGPLVGNNSNRNYYGRGGSTPPNRMMNNPPPYNYRGGWKRK